MDEYNSIKWRETFDDDNKFITSKEFEESNINKFLNDTLNPTRIRNEFLSYKKRCKVSQDYPGSKFYSIIKHQSNFNTVEHQRLINALKILQEGKIKLNKIELEDRNLYNNSQQLMKVETANFLKVAEEKWKQSDFPIGIKINHELYKYAFQERMAKLLAVKMDMPKLFVSVDLLPWSHSDADLPIEMVHTANVLDLGVVSQYSPPILVGPFILDRKFLPPMKANNYYSKMSISQDKNIEEYFTTGSADAAISISALKKIMHYTDTNQLWTMPVLIKSVPTSNGPKKVIFFDKPLPTQHVSNVDFNERCHKLLVRSNMCILEAFRFPYQDKLIRKDDAPENKIEDERILHNVAYKLWTLSQESAEINIRSKKHNATVFNVLVRTKVDACRQCEYGLQGITVVPKLEYQLKFGANICTKKETVNHWVDLFFRPRSVMQRIRTQHLSSEVIKIETVNLAKVNVEAMQHHNLKMNNALGVLYKLLLSFERHQEGFYLLRHELKNGAFVSLYRQTEDELAQNVFDLHEEYTKHIEIIEPYHKTWTPIDPTVLLPAYEKRGHYPALFTPCKGQFKKKKPSWATKKANKKKKKKKQLNEISPVHPSN